MHYVIAGGGAAGWITAAVLSRYLSAPSTRITLIESEDIGIIGVGEATVPVIGELNRLLDIHEPDFVAATNGTFKLGIEFVDWGETGRRHFHGFGDYGEPIAALSPHHHWLRLHRQDNTIPPLDDWSMPWAAASQDRFAPHEAMQGEAAEFRHAYHFDATLYAAYLRKIAEKHGVKRVEGRILHAARHSETGFVTHLDLADGQRITGDIFIDCTGFASLLLERAMNVGFRDWSHWLPCDRAATISSARAGRLTPFTRSTARTAGWQWRIPLQNRTGNGHVYASSFLSDDEATARLFDGLEGEALGEPRMLRFTPGRRERFWEGNVIAIGLAAGFLEPLESTALQLIQTGAARIIELLPGRQPEPALADEYNRRTTLEYERIRDFIIAHYCRSCRSEPFWRHVAAMDLPDTLQHKLALWGASGHIALYDMESHREPSWVSVLIGQGVLPRAYDPRADMIPPDRLTNLMKQRRAYLAQAARKMPCHDYFIDKTCAADQRL
ncbi:tryptophan 7-halogenase [Altericroceibacterium spongiae]|uniref:Tryptophan 7-halogenase n=1 Tax=Altericroceibacterium spongiae TaxID=2320269 RepID=A0A420EE99_9SPHN|nr:tryptophan halogenase family protein [Altericroceibacterium spongiae]RKF18972.1 tryptophan 7-halogenase [Altericroceibacterium spongiae]